MATTSLLLLLPATAWAHGSMYEPPSRNSGGMAVLSPTGAGGACQWYSQGCSIGCAECSQKYSAEPDCENPAEPTLLFGEDDDLIAYRTDGHGSVTTYFPWRYPGKAPVLDSCGVTGGGTPPLGQLDPPTGHLAGEYGTDTARAPVLLETTHWVAGSVVEVAFGLAANHGGGYQYRLCPAGATLDEECFQQNPLEFVGELSWIQFGDGMDPAMRHEIPAHRIGGPWGRGEKVWPVNSTWTRNPIPGCVYNGARDKKPCVWPTFDPPLPGMNFTYGLPSPKSGLFGYSGGHCMGNKTKDPECVCTNEEYADAMFTFGVVDKVRVPAALPPGDYVLSWRWDCEQTKQIWSSCGDVTVHAADAPDAKATVPFSPQRGCTACSSADGLCANCTACVDDKTSPECQYCWTPMLWWAPHDYWSPRSSHIQCLGYEAADGGASAFWRPGDNVSYWSPGCPKCWADPTSAEPFERALASAELALA